MEKFCYSEYGALMFGMSGLSEWREVIVLSIHFLTKKEDVEMAVILNALIRIKNNLPALERMKSLQFNCIQVVFSDPIL